MSVACTLYLEIQRYNMIKSCSCQYLGAALNTIGGSYEHICELLEMLNSVFGFETSIR
jgi:hypothetical protein